MAEKTIFWFTISKFNLIRSLYPEQMEEKLVKKKVNLLGNQGVGKTSLIIRYVKDLFGEEYLKTIGTNIYTKDVQFEEGMVKLVIQDIMGESGFKTVKRGAFKGSAGAIAVADVTRPSSLEGILNDWILTYRKYSSEDNPIILAVNKFDLEKKEIKTDDLEKSYSEFDHILFTSAKTGRNVEYLFKYLASKVAYNMQVSTNDLEHIILERELDTPKDLLDVMLSISSESGDISYEVREGLLEESGIDKFDLDEKIYSIEEENVLRFAKLLMYLYEEEDNVYSFDLIQKVLKKYGIKY